MAYFFVRPTHPAAELELVAKRHELRRLLKGKTVEVFGAPLTDVNVDLLKCEVAERDPAAVEQQIHPDVIIWVVAFPPHTYEEIDELLEKIATAWYLSSLRGLKAELHFINLAGWKATFEIPGL